MLENSFNNKSYPWIVRYANALWGLLLLVFGIGSVFQVVASSESSSLTVAYIGTWVTLAILYILTYRNIASPTGISLLWFVVCFVVPIPFMISPDSRFPIPFTHTALGVSLFLALFALLSFNVARLMPVTWFAKSTAIVFGARHQPTSRYGIFFIFTFCYIVMGYFLRVAFGIGQAGVVTTLTIPLLPGIMEFSFNRGALILIGLYAYLSLATSAYAVMGSLVLAILFAGSQAMLGWKDGLAEVAIVLLVCFWFHHVNKPGLQRLVLIALVFVCALIPLSLQLGYAVRGATLDRETQYADSTYEFAMRVVFRLDGHQRLIEVIEHEAINYDLSLTNNFKIITLAKDGVTTTKYADYVIFDVDPGITHSVGASGPGGAYIGMGLAGVALGYFLLGILYSVSYKAIHNSTHAAPAVVFYAVLCVILRQMFAENFNTILFAKQLLVMLAILIVAVRLTARSSTNSKSLPSA